MLICLTASHRNASFDLLERLSIGAPSAVGTLVDGSDFVSGAVVLATCNRFEAYLDVDEPLTAGSALAVEATIETMSTASGVEPDDLRDSVRVITGDEVVEHLFAVSSGLESVVVGEDEISGQVRRSLERARRDGTTSRDLEPGEPGEAYRQVIADGLADSDLTPAGVEAYLDAAVRLSADVRERRAS